jgi:hypothetical protein
MQDDLRSELKRIAQAIAFPSPGTVALAGRTAPAAMTAPPQVPGAIPSANPLVAQLQHLLYDWCYCRRFGTAVPAPASAPAAEQEFLASLTAANASRERWDAGWRIQQTLPSGQIAVVKGAATRMVWPGEFLAHGAPGLPPSPGSEISLFAPRESRVMQPGFYFVFGETLADQEEEMSLVRFYWHVTAAGAAPLVAGLTQALNRFAIPFRFKCLSMAQLYDRTDPAVLYLAKRYYRIAAEVLPPAYKTVHPFLRAGTPLFSKSLAAGLGFAENPKSGESFGMNRCRLVAEAICNAHARGIDAADARLADIASAFETAGLSLDRPYLNPGSADHYGFVESQAA